MLCDKIEVRSHRDSKNKKLDKSSIEPRKSNLVHLTNYDFEHLYEGCFNEKLLSSRPIFKSIIYLRNQ